MRNDGFQVTANRVIIDDLCDVIVVSKKINEQHDQHVLFGCEPDQHCQHDQRESSFLGSLCSRLREPLWCGSQ
jgi:hypothetical protein